MASLSRLERAASVLPWVFALVFFLQGLFGSLEKSLTWDEPVFIASGYTYLVRNDLRLNRESPPLLQQAVALPLLWMRLTLPDESDPDWQTAKHFRFARTFAERNASAIRRIALFARMPILLLGAGLVVLIGRWSGKLYGPTASAASAGIAAFSPNLLAHAKLATTDLGCAAGMFLAVFTFQKAIHAGTRVGWIACGLATGVALLTKYTALLLGPIYLLIGLLVWRLGMCSIKHLVHGALWITALALLVVTVGYNLSLSQAGYVQGLSNIYAHSRPGYLFYLNGNLSESPWWHYYFQTLGLKVPTPILVLVAFSLLTVVCRPVNRVRACFSLIPVFVILSVTCFDPTNLGLRRVLPVLPFLFLLCGQTLATPFHWLRPWIVAALLGWAGWEAAAVYPDHLAYFNRFAGGPAAGPYLLDDSNIDWGQDLPALARWQNENPTSDPLKLQYFGNVPPEIYGIEFVEMADEEIFAPKPGVYAVSAHSLVWFRKIRKRYGSGPQVDWLTAYRPFARAGYSIYLYRFPQQKTR